MLLEIVLISLGLYLVGVYGWGIYVAVRAGRSGRVIHPIESGTPASEQVETPVADHGVPTGYPPSEDDASERENQRIAA